jgi:hypothetical protein
MWPAERSITDVSELLQQQTALDQIGAEILQGGPRAIRYRETRPGGTSMVFVARHADVVTVLTDEKHFSLGHYNPLYSAIAPPGATIIMRPEGKERRERLEILEAAKARTPWFGPDPTARRALARACVDDILTAVRRRRRFDLIAEYGFFAPYLIAKRVVGLGGPRSFSLLPLIWVANGHPVSQLFAPETAPYVTDLAWSEVVVLQLLGNFEDRSWPIKTVARCGASHLRNQFEHYVDAVSRTAADQTLLSALWGVRDDFPNVERQVYREHVVSIMMELAGTLLVIPGLGFYGAIDRWLQPGGPGFKESLRQIQAMDAEAFAQEQLRLAPPATHLLRNATGPIELGGLKLDPGEYVCALVKAAGVDMPDPANVEAGRCPAAYLHFGPENGPHRCIGHLLSPAMLAEMFLGLTRLPDLAPQSARVVAGVGGSVPGRLIVDFGAQDGAAP